ncbi:MAG: hypothetical protein RMY29_011565 [Nostoc sp. CreGUA01]|nr:hypothetical protein [Nostoc sp. CreGUA01]
MSPSLPHLPTPDKGIELGLFKLSIRVVCYTTIGKGLWHDRNS